MATDFMLLAYFTFRVTITDITLSVGRYFTLYTISFATRLARAQKCPTGLPRPIEGGGALILYYYKYCEERPRVKDMDLFGMRRSESTSWESRRSSKANISSGWPDL